MGGGSISFWNLDFDTHMSSLGAQPQSITPIPSLTSRACVTADLPVPHLQNLIWNSSDVMLELSQKSSGILISVISSCEVIVAMDTYVINL